MSAPAPRQDFVHDERWGLRDEASLTGLESYPSYSSRNRLHGIKSGLVWCSWAQFPIVDV